MPGTTRYSATFDRPYEEEEDDLPANPPVARRSRSHSLQATTIGNGRPYTPLGGAYRPHARSSSTDNGAPKGAEVIPTRTVGKAAVKAHSNPFQFVKVGTCPLYKKAEEQLKTVKEDKKPEVVKEEEEEWQTNLDSWKSRRRKMSESAFRRQEEMKQIEMEEKTFCTQQKKIKTFSEMVEERAHRGRTLSLCLFSNPLDLDEWKYDKNKNTEDDDTNSNDNQPLSGESEESSVIHSEDDSNDTYLKHEQSHADRNGNKSIQNGVKLRRTGAPNVLHKQNGFHKDALKTNSDFKLAELDISQESITQKEEHGLSGIYIDSGLESLSSSHRAGDIPDSGSDFSQDSGSSMDCDSPRVTRLITTGVELLEEFSSKDDDLSNGDVFHNEKSSGMEFSLRLCLTGNSSHHYGFTISGGKDKGSSVTVASVIKGSVSDSAGLKTDDQILAVNNEDISSLTHSAVVSLLKKAVDTRQINLLLRRSLPADNTKKLSSSVPIAATRNKTSAKSDNSNKLDSEVLKNKLTANSSEKNAESKDDISKKQAPKILNAFGKDVNARNKQTEIDASSHKERSVESENEMYVDDFDELELMEKNNVAVSMAQENVASPGVDSNASNVTNKSDPIVGHNNKAPISCAAAKDSSLNIIYQSHSSGSLPTTQNTSKKSSESKICNGDNIQTPKVYSNATTPVNEVPVEKVAEEMERLILEQLEQEERAKEMASEIESNGNFETENQIHKQIDMEAPPRQLEPPKEKPPPPPSSTNSSQKPCSLKRVNSTKRIKKEIHKRRSDFLGIDTDEENAMCDESSVPLPPALEDILKAEREGDRVRRQMLVDASLQKSVEDEEIARKEREIIANLETEERRKLNIDGNFPDTSNSSEAQIEEERINRLKEERKLIEEERLMKEEQKIRLDEERLLCEREDYVRKQEPEPKPKIQMHNTDESIDSIASAELLSRKTNLSDHALPNTFSKMNDCVSDSPILQVKSPNQKGIFKKNTASTPLSKPAVKCQNKCSNARPKVPSDINIEQHLDKLNSLDNSNISISSVDVKIENSEKLKSPVVNIVKGKSESEVCTVVSGTHMTENENSLQKSTKNHAKELSKIQNIPKTNTTDFSVKHDSKEEVAMTDRNVFKIPSFVNVKDEFKISSSKDFNKDNAKYVAKTNNSSKKPLQIKENSIEVDPNNVVESNQTIFTKNNTKIMKGNSLAAGANDIENKHGISRKDSTKVLKKSTTEAVTDVVASNSSSSIAAKNDAAVKNEISTEAVTNAVVSKVAIFEKNTTAFKKESNRETLTNDVVSKDAKNIAKVKKEKSTEVVTNIAVSKDAKNIAKVQKQKSTEAVANSLVSKDAKNNPKVQKESITEVVTNVAVSKDAKNNTKVQKESLEVVANNVGLSKVAISEKNTTAFKKESSRETVENDAVSKDAKSNNIVKKESITDAVANIVVSKDSKNIAKVQKEKSIEAVANSLVSKDAKNNPKVQKESITEVVTNVAVSKDAKNNTKVQKESLEVVANNVVLSKVAISEKNTTAFKKESSRETVENDAVSKDAKSNNIVKKESITEAVANVVVSKDAKNIAKVKKEKSIEAVANDVISKGTENNTIVKKESSREPVANDVVVSKDAKNNDKVKKESNTVANEVTQSQDATPAKNNTIVKKETSTGAVVNVDVGKKDSKVLVQSTLTSTVDTPNQNEDVAKCEKVNGPNLVRVRKKGKKGIKPAGSCSSISVTTPDNTNTDGNIKTPSEQSKVEINANSDVSCDQLCDLKDKTCDISQKDDSSVKPTPVLSLPATSTINIAKPTPDSSFSSSATNNMLVQNGDGQNTNMSILVAPSNDKISKTEETVPPPVPKKPVKKKEVIRKERERLRHEQEVLMREREEYRRKVQLEQEQLKKNSQKPHVSDVPMSRVGPPPPAKPALPSQLTPPTHVPQALREDMYASRSLQCSGRNNIAENHAVASQQQSQRQAASRQNRVAQPRTKPALNEAWTQHKVPVVRKQTDSSAESRYNQNHWLIQEAEMRRITEQKERQRGQIPTDTRYQPTTQIPFHQTPHIEESSGSHMAVQRPTVMPAAQPLTVKPSNYSMITPMHASEQQWNYGQPVHPNAQNRKYPSPPVVNMGSDTSQPVTAYSRNFTDPNLQPPTKPSRIVPVEKQEQMLSVSGRKRCSHCGEELGRGAAMIIESLQLYYHIHCFRCCVCQAQLGNGSCGTDVRVRNNKLHCHNCYSNDEAGLKFSQV